MNIYKYSRFIFYNYLTLTNKHVLCSHSNDELCLFIPNGRIKTVNQKFNININ